MTPVLDLSAVLARTGCQKPGCTREPVYRHHKADEHKWVRAFQHRRSQERTYQDFVRRYLQYRPSDCVHLCGDHHEEIHTIYWDEVDLYLQRHPGLLKPFQKWTWSEARALMSKLSAVCDEWLQTPTPGVGSRRFTTYQ